MLVQTDLGDIEIAVDTTRAPISGGLFLEQVDAGLYTSGRFHRTVKMDNQPANDVKIEVIQAGIDPTREKELGDRLDGLDDELRRGAERRISDDQLKQVVYASAHPPDQALHHVPLPDGKER